MKTISINSKIKLSIILVLVSLSLSCEKSTSENVHIKHEIDLHERFKKIDVVHQKINLIFDWEKKQAKGTTSITFSNLTTSDTLLLDAGMLTILSVKLNGEKKIGFKYDGLDADNGLKIVLDKKYKPEEEITVSIEYHTNLVNQSDPNNIWGSFGKGIRFFEPSLTEKERRKQIWAVGEATTNKYWFPCYDAPNDLHTSEFIATVENPLMAISNGVLIDTKDNKNGTRTFHWKSNIPHANHLTSFVIGEYQNYQQYYKNIKLNNYGYPNEYIGTKESVVRLPDMVQFFSNLTGKEYPYETYSQIFVQDFGGYKSSMMTSIITENMVDDKTTHEDFLYLWDLTQGEALVNQWFGNLITIKDWSHVWLSKGFSRYISGMYSEHKNGRDEFLLYQNSPDLNTYLSDWNSNHRIPVVTDKYENIESFVNGNYPYSKGSLVLNMLRNELGENKWKQVIKKYVNSYANKLVRTKDFINTVNQVNGESLDWFFDQWIYKIGHPKFKVEKKYDHTTKQLHLTVKQIQKLDSVSKYEQVLHFKGKMIIEIDDNLKSIEIEPKEENSFSFQLESQPTFVNIDFENSWIKEIEFKKKQEELIAQLQNSKDVMAKVSAMNELANIANDSTTTNETKLLVKNEFQKVILNKQYWWRTRLIALWQLQSLMPSSLSNHGVEMNNETIKMLLKLIKEEKSWLKASAINTLGMTRSPKYTPIYIESLTDYSDRVVNMAAVALGKTRSPKAFDALIKLKDKPSWKNQSLISALYGLKELQDPRAYDLAIKSLTDSDNPHWNLGTPVWDHRLAAAYTLVAIGKSDKGYPLIFEQFKDAMMQDYLNDIFYNALQVTILADARGQEIFDLLKKKYKNDKNTMMVITNLENQFNNTIKK